MKTINFLLPSFGLKPVGGFKIAYTYANFLKGAGYEVNIIYAHQMKEKKDFYSYCHDLFMIKGRKRNWFRLKKGIKEFYRMELNEKTIPNADVTIATAWATAVVLNSLSVKKGKKVYLIQSYEIWSGDKSSVDRTWRYNDMKKIVISRWLYHIGEELGSKDMVYIPNSINFRKYTVSKPIEERRHVVAMLFNPFILKGSKKGIEALRQVKKEVPDLEVLLFGIEERERYIPNWMIYYKNPKQSIIVQEIYNQASIFLCPSMSEGWGLPPMEAMSCGCAVVSTRNGGVEDFAIHKKTALLCDVGDVEGMKDAIITLLNDKELRLKLGNRGRNYVRKFSWRKSFRLFRQVIDEC